MPIKNLKNNAEVYTVVEVDDKFGEVEIRLEQIESPKAFATVDAALNTFTSGRFIGLTAYIISEGNEYWFSGGTDDINFVPKTPSYFRWNTI